MYQFALFPYIDWRRYSRVLCVTYLQQNQKLLLDCVAKSDVDGINKLMSKGVDPNFVSSKGGWCGDAFLKLLSNRYGHVIC
jgi:hypothetical protein